MKKWIAIILTIVMTLSLCACSKKDDGKGAAEEEKNVAVSLLTEVVETEEDYDGKSRTLRTTVQYDDEYNVIGTKMYVGDELRSEETYDKDIEKPLVYLEYDEDGDVNGRVEYIYDSNGNCIEQNSTYTDSNGDTDRGKRIRTFDANGNELTEKVYYDGELQYDYSYTYNADGKVLTYTCIEANGSKDAETYTYDDHGNVLSKKTVRIYDGENYSDEETYENKYENGKLAEVTRYEDGVRWSYTKYDADGNEVLYINYDSDGGETYRTENTYENGKLVKTADKWGDSQDVTTYTYNSAGKITERNYTSSDGSNSRTVFAYSDVGNLTSMEWYHDGELSGKATMTYKEVTVSKETAEKIKELQDIIAENLA